MSSFFPISFFLALSRAAFATIVDGKNEEMSTSELSGGARIHYIFQAIFVKRLEVGGGCQLSLQG